MLDLARGSLVVKARAVFEIVTSGADLFLHLAVLYLKWGLDVFASRTMTPLAAHPGQLRCRLRVCETGGILEACNVADHAFRIVVVVFLLEGMICLLMLILPQPEGRKGMATYAL